jgi:enoyl-CoA hydratase/carnithine racemase
MGTNRGRYFLLTGQTISAQEAKDVGLISEILPIQDLLPRAWELARYLKMRSPLLRRYSRVLATQELKKKILDLHGYGLALEGLAATHNSNEHVEK